MRSRRRIHHRKRAPRFHSAQHVLLTGNLHPRNSCDTSLHGEPFPERLEHRFRPKPPISNITRLSDPIKCEFGSLGWLCFVCKSSVRSAGNYAAQRWYPCDREKAFGNGLLSFPVYCSEIRRFFLDYDRSVAIRRDVVDDGQSVPTGLPALRSRLRRCEEGSILRPCSEVP